MDTVQRGEQCQRRGVVALPDVAKRGIMPEAPEHLDTLMPVDLLEFLRKLWIRPYDRRRIAPLVQDVAGELLEKFVRHHVGVESRSCVRCCLMMCSACSPDAARATSGLEIGQ